MSDTPQSGPEEKLESIGSRLKSGQPVDPVTVRQLLNWFGVERRGSWIVRWIRIALDNAGLATEPDFQGTWIDGPIKFITIENPKEPRPAEVKASTPATALGIVSLDPTYRIGKLEAANRPPVSVAPNQTVTEAITVMLANDFSQLPVMVGARDVKGIVSWNSIGSRLVLGANFKEVRECMDTAFEISADTSLFDAIDDIVAHEYVLIRDSTEKISGIVTTSDLSTQFRQLAEPFLVLGEIENHMRLSRENSCKDVGTLMIQRE